MCPSYLFSNLSMSWTSAGSGNISFECRRRDDERSLPPFRSLPCEPIVPDRLKLLPPALDKEADGSIVTSERLWCQLPNKEAFQELPMEVDRNCLELEFSSLTTFNGFSKALRMYFITGRLEGFGLRQDLATTATAHASSNRSSSTINDGSRIFVTSSLLFMLMQGKVWSNHSLISASGTALIPSFPVTSSSNTFPKQ